MNGVTKLFAFLYPPVCVGCGKEGSWWCDGCGGLEVRGVSGEMSWWYSYANPHVAALIRGAKYSRYFGMLEQLVYLVPTSFWHEVVGVSAPILVPIPTPKVRLKERGFCQAEVISRSLCKRFNVRTDKILVARKKPSLVGMNREEREKTVKGAFILKRGVRLRKDATYLLIDDVYTTGSTFRECQKILQEAGAGVVRAFALAHEPLLRNTENTTE